MKILQFLNILDDSGNLSITNCALIAFLVKILLSPQLDGPSVVGLVGLLANYCHKRQVNNQGNLDDHKRP